ncbi:hypothetical protein [Phenylobacterium montanum]|uniref:Adenosine deaminase domain-containing protein n=1 Tax=Phenylobacterium montanum TaxID=2823693 RepID=A0A975FW40_9CAUL|nr:hypothetical protein [Caulobacter sp. S6]QUD86049.1 hypothetical protein KCG34_13135 [Caulobacter sp. S6]
MSALIYRRAFTDTFGLRTFAGGEVPDLESVKRRIFITERRSAVDRPDHFYKNYLEVRLGRLSSVAALPWRVLSALAERFIERRNGKLCIRAGTFEDWREALPMISPIAVIVAFLVAEGRIAGDDDPRTRLTDDLGDTALLSPSNPLLATLIERDGLNEMHMHLNGATEADILWADAVRYPREYHDELMAAQIRAHGLTSQLYDQIELGLTPYEIFRRLRAARRVRHAMAEAFRQPQDRGQAPLNMSRLLTLMNVELDDREADFEPIAPASDPPVTAIWAGTSTALIDEGAFLLACLSAASQPGPLQEVMGLGLYFNLLVQTLVGRISMQQVDEVGFDQFQKYTVIGVRERLERAYEKRFSQLNIGPPHRVLTHLEGRLAPKNSVEELAKLVDSISQGWLRFRGCPRLSEARGLRGAAPRCMTGQFCGEGCAGGPSTGRDNSELSLVVHFIKRKLAPPSGRIPECRDGPLRADLARQADVVHALRQRHPFAAQILRGIDAAANELHASPEVFGPIFRRLRRDRDLHATYHVGEDFIHLVSGIRASAEALAYLGLGSGDRLGHATALGIAPALWLGRTGERLVISRGEHLDNATFAHALLSQRRGHERALSNLRDVIARRSAEILGEEHGPHLLHEAWRLRGLDILELLELERICDLEPGDAMATAAAANFRAEAIASPSRQDELRRLARAGREHPLAFRLFRQRHREQVVADQLVEVKTTELDERDLTAMQDLVLGDTNGAGVVIETLPTSNVRIAAYRGLADHHLFRWLGIATSDLSNRPAVCVGSDDTGIFATSLRNEHAAIFEVLTGHYGRPADEAIEIISRLNATGFAFRFRPLLQPPPRRLGSA